MDSKNILLIAALTGLAMTANGKETSTPSPKKSAKEVEGECHEMNSCRGTSACHSEKNSCAGANACKGKGWLKTTEKACKEKKGKFKSV